MGKLFLVSGVLCGLVGMSLGIHMGAAHDFTLAPAHAHLNLVGYVTLFLAGLFYQTHPQAEGGLAKLHFLLGLLGALVLATGIGGSVKQLPWGEPTAIAGSFVTIAGMILFTIQVIRHGGTAR
jgi:hypothetical protein